MKLLGDDTDATWKHFGAKDPYYGVVSHDEYRRDRLDEISRRRFFQSGEQEISDLFTWLMANGFDAHRGRAIDFGCGVGRLVLPLSERFKAVLGIDISPHMLAEASANAQHHDRRNVSFSTEIPAEADFDFIHSLYVLQHIDAQRGTELLFRLWDRLAPGGILCVQVPTAFRGSIRGNILRRVRKVAPAIQIPLNIARGHPWNDPGMQMNLYNTNLISFGLSQRGANIVALHRKDSDRTNYAGSYIISVKPR